MVSFLRGWSHPAPPSGPAASSSSSFTDTVVAAALGAIALITANAFDRTNPALATMLRCAAGGVGLIWLFNRCCPTSTGHGHRVVSAPIVVGGSSPIYTRAAPHPHVHVHPAPAPRHTGGFPTVHRAPAQPDPTPLYRAPVTRAPVHPAPAPNFSHPPQQAHTTFSHAAPKPHVYPTAPPPSHINTESFPNVKPAPAQMGGGFPTVHRAPAQSDLRPMHTAPEIRGGFHSVKSTSGPQGNSSQLGNDRPMFPAATHRI